MFLNNLEDHLLLDVDASKEGMEINVKWYAEFINGAMDRIKTDIKLPTAKSFDLSKHMSDYLGKLLGELDAHPDLDKFY